MNRDQLVASRQDNRRAQDVPIGKALELDVNQLVLIVTVEQIAEPARCQRKLAEDSAVGSIGDELAQRWTGNSHRSGRLIHAQAENKPEAARQATDDHEPLPSDVPRFESGIASRRSECIPARSPCNDSLGLDDNFVPSVSEALEGTGLPKCTRSRRSTRHPEELLTGSLQVVRQIRFRDKLVASRGQGEVTLGGQDACAQDQDLRSLCRRTSSNCPCEVEPVAVGQAHIEDDQVVISRSGRLIRGLKRVRLGDDRAAEPRIAGPGKYSPEQEEVGGIILDDEDPGWLVDGHVRRRLGRNAERAGSPD